MLVKAYSRMASNGGGPWWLFDEIVDCSFVMAALMEWGRSLGGGGRCCSKGVSGSLWLVLIVQGSD